MTAPYLALAEGENVTPTLPLDEIDIILRSGVLSFARGSGMTVISERQATFHAHAARSAILERADTRYQLLVAAYSGSQIYVLLAPQGSKYDALVSSFRAI